MMQFYVLFYHVQLLQFEINVYILTALENMLSLYELVL